MAAPSYTCGEVTNMFYALQNQVGPDLYNKVAPLDPWYGYALKGEFPEGQGFSINRMMLERTVTDSEDGTEWVDATPSLLSSEQGGPNNNCLLTPEVLKFGQTLQSYNLQRRNIQTDDFCLNDLKYDFQIERVLDNLMDILGFVTEWVWSNRIQNEYGRLCKWNITEGTPFNITATSFNVNTPPDSRLINGTLERIYRRLIMNGAHMYPDSTVGKGNADQPIFNLFTDEVTSRDLIRQDPELRADFRYADPDKLINTLGTPMSYNGFKHTWIKYPPRWNIVNGAWVRVYPFNAATQATKGFSRDPNDAYDYAQIQDHFIFIPTVMRVLFEKPNTNPGGKLRFDAFSHMGDFTFQVIKDRKCNPRGETGFFDALYASGSEPIHTELGYRLRTLNCPALRSPMKPSCYS